MEISVLIITRGRLDSLKKNLASLDLLPGQLTVKRIVVLNGEDPASEEYLKANLSSPHLFIKIPVASQATAYIEGIKHVTGDWVFMLSDASYIGKKYAEKLLPLLEKKYDVFGGVNEIPPDAHWVAAALGLALKSPLCTGLTFKRHGSLSGPPEEASEIVLSLAHLWIRTSLLHPVKNMLSTQSDQGADDLFISQLKAQSKIIMFVPQLKVFHYQLNQLGEIHRSAFTDGFGRAERLIEEKNFSSWYYLTTIFLILHTVAMLDLRFFLLLAKSYLILSLVILGGLCLKAKKGHLFVPALMFQYSVLFCYSIGFTVAFFKRNKKNGGQ